MLLRLCAVYDSEVHIRERTVAQLRDSDQPDSVLRLLEPSRNPEDRYHIMLDGRLFLPAIGSFLSGSDPRHFCVEQFVADANNASLGVMICNAEAPMMMPGPNMMKTGDMESC